LVAFFRKRLSIGEATILMDRAGKRRNTVTAAGKAVFQNRGCRKMGIGFRALDKTGYSIYG